MVECSTFARVTGARQPELARVAPQACRYGLGRPATKEVCTMVTERKGRGRGFASMDSNKQREIASKGGRAAHTQGTAHEWTSEEARQAGRKGGAASRQRIDLK